MRCFLQRITPNEGVARDREVTACYPSELLVFCVYMCTCLSVVEAFVR